MLHHIPRNNSSILHISLKNVHDKVVSRSLIKVYDKSVLLNKPLFTKIVIFVPKTTNPWTFFLLESRLTYQGPSYSPCPDPHYMPTFSPLWSYTSYVQMIVYHSHVISHLSQDGTDCWQTPGHMEDLYKWLSHWPVIYTLQLYHNATFQTVIASLIGPQCTSQTVTASPLDHNVLAKLLLLLLLDHNALAKLLVLPLLDHNTLV